MTIGTLAMLRSYAKLGKVERLLGKDFFRSLIFVTTICGAATPGLGADGSYDRRVAFLVGIGHYEGGSGKGIFRNLPVWNDLEKLADALRIVGFGEINIYSDTDPPTGSKNEYIPLLQPGTPAGMRVSSLDIDRQIESRLEALSDTGRTLLLIYFTGHGGLLSATDRVIATPNSQIGSTKSFLRVRDILNRMADTPSTVDKILIVDACADLIDSKPRPSEVYASRSEEELPVYFFSSSMGEPSFVDPANQTSVFTHHLVQALTRARDLGLVSIDGAIASEKIRDYLLSVVPDHKSLTLKRTVGGEGMPGKRKVQHPFASGRQRIVFGHEPNNLPAPSEGASDEDKAAYYRGLREAFYGSRK